jgi:hypothetical protein
MASLVGVKVLGQLNRLCDVAELVEQAALISHSQVEEVEGTDEA